MDIKGCKRIREEPWNQLGQEGDLTAFCFSITSAVVGAVVL